MKKEKNYNIIFMRFLAIIIVMFGHSIIIYDHNWGLFTSNNSSSILTEIKRVINIIQMPIWFSMSGFLFFNTITNGKKFFSVIYDKFKKIIIPFLIIGIFYLLPIRLIIGYQNYSNNSFIYNIIINIILGFDNGHLWYLPTLFIMFVIFYYSPKNNSILIDIFIVVILIISNMYSYHLKVYLYDISLYSIFFYAGFLLNKYSINKNFHLIVLLSLIFVLFIFKTNSSLFLLSIQLLFIFIIYNTSFKKIGKNKIINNISKNSYGMYLFHSPLIYITFKYLPNISIILMVFINFIIFGSLSFIMTSLLRKSKLKFIIGE